MRMAWAVPVAVTVLTAAPARGGQGGDQPLTVSVVRFFSPASATTTIDGVCEVRLGALASGPAQMVRYRLEVAVSDSAGLVLQSSDQAREVPAAVARTSGATAVETFDFRAAPGRYRVVVRAVPETGTPLERALDVSAYAARPPLSDLLLATGVRAAGADSGTAAVGEIQRGGLLLRTAPVPRLSPTEATLSYYAEVYPWAGATMNGSLTAAVLGAGRRVVVRTARQPVEFTAAGGAARGSVDLTGLPAGSYVLRLEVALGDSTLADEAPFAMGEMPAPTATAATQSSDPFDGMSEAVLDSLYAPLVYLLDASQQGMYEQLSADGKRRFLREFWQRKDPSLQQMRQFYGLVGYANDAFREGGAAQIPGWRTDRGRIFLRNGRWDDILQRPMASPLPYQVWKYTRGRQRYYIFSDRTGLGHYQLIGTNDRQEPGLPSWQSMLGSESYVDVARFLGISTVDVPE